MFLLSGRARVEGVFSWVGVQVPSLVSKYVKGVWLEVWKNCHVHVCANAATVFRRTHVRMVELTALGNTNVVLLWSQGVSLPSLLNAPALE